MRQERTLLDAKTCNKVETGASLSDIRGRNEIHSFHQGKVNDG